jgi:hypothetical protein
MYTISYLRNITENFERPALSDHVILVGAPIVLTCYGDVHNKLFISFDKALNKNLPSGITLSGNFALTRLQWPDMNTSNIEIHNFKINWKVPSH